LDILPESLVVFAGKIEIDRMATGGKYCIILTGRVQQHGVALYKGHQRAVVGAGAFP
jgi:hypothetical protein